jgi:hypothetical protein
MTNQMSCCYIDQSLLDFFFFFFLFKKYIFSYKVDIQKQIFPWSHHLIIPSKFAKLSYLFS